MNKFLLLLCSICYLSLNATNHIVNTVGMSFSPSSLTIDIGDTVTWHNTGGSHNINATQSTFPNNPEGFGNTVGIAWTFQWIFTIAGTYDYQCDPHAPGMSGVIIVNALAQPLTNDLFISEYAEGSSYNKYIEIYNGTGYSVDLSDYDIWKIVNGGNWPEYSLSLTGTLANNEVYIICSSHSTVNATILNAADTLWSSASWNGDDAVGLAKNGILIDAVGNGVDPGVAWDVAGVVEATSEHTLIRKCSVNQGDTNWIASAGVDSLTSQWLVYPQNYWLDIDQHSSFCGCTDPLACNYDSLANTDDGSCAYDVIWQQSEIICNGDSLMVGSSIYYLSGAYTDSLSTMYGCDSIVYTNLIVDTATNFQQSLTLCEGDSLVVGSNVYYNAGNYSDTLTTIGGCDSIIFSNLGFYPQTPLIIQSSPDPAEICLGDTITLEASAGFSQYSWYAGTSQVGQNHILFATPNDDQWYMVVAVDANGCMSKEDINVYVDSCITGFDEINSTNILLIYPNPASNQLTIEFMVKSTGIRVYNILGELVTEKSIKTGEKSMRLNVKDWQTAIYSIQLYKEDGVITNKVLNVVR